jgi:hypothetical protein
MGIRACRLVSACHPFINRAVIDPRYASLTTPPVASTVLA